MKKILLACLLVAGIMMPLVPSIVYAEGEDICSGPLANDPMSGCGSTENVGNIAEDVIKVVIGLVAVLAVGVMIFGGIMYTTSVGDAQKAYRARNIIIYGLVGLVVSILAYSIVLFVTQGIG